MASKKKLDILLGMDNAELKKKLKESQSLLKSFKGSLGGILGGAALGISVKNLGDYALNASKAFETASISFKVLLGNEEKAAKLVKDIEALANVTPMSSSGLQENAKLLLNFNAVAEDEIIPTLRMLGDITGGDEVKMSSLTLAFAQCASAGRLMGQDLLQMINAGFNPLQIMSEKTGKSIATLKEEMSDGKISVEMVTQAFKDATAEGGRFYGMMKEQAESKAGLEATKADSYEILARTITDRAIPALKEFDKAQIEAANSATENVKTLYKWMDVNNETMYAVKNTALVLTSAALSYVALKKAVLTLTTAYASLANISGKVTYSQIALSALLKGQVTQAFTMATLAARKFMLAMAANPWTWVAAAIAGVAGAILHLKNEAERTAAVIEDINNKYVQQNQELQTNIDTINDLVEVKERTVAQEEELNRLIGEITQKYPEFNKELDKELVKRNGINKELAKSIYLRQLEEKQIELQKQKTSIDKKVDQQRRSYVINNQIAAARYGTPVNTRGGRYGVKKSLQKDQDNINAQLKAVEDLINKINNDEIGYGSASSKSSKKSSKGYSSGKSAKNAQKEALALKLAQLDAELLLVKNNAEESYKIELQKIQARLNAEKKGTSEYQTILNDRTKLEQQYNDQVIQLEIERYNRKAELEQLQIEQQKSALESQNEAGGISSSDYYTKLQELEDQKYNIALAGLQKQEELYKDDLAKLEQINHEKLILTNNHEVTKQELVTESLKTENEQWKELLSDIGESFQDNLAEFFKGNQSLKESFLNVFDEIKGAFAGMIAEMLAKKALLNFKSGVNTLSGAGGWIGTAANFIKGFFADGGIVPGSYNQAMPIVAHGSEMVLNPLQQKKLWNMIASGSNTQTTATQGQAQAGQSVIVNNITPVFQSLDPAQGQKMFTDWMKQSGVLIVKDSIKNNNHQMRDMIKGV